MKNLTNKLLLLSFICGFTFSNSAFGSNAWDRMADFGGGEREFSFGFSIGSYGYAGGGRSPAQHNDLWQYDPVSDSWTQKADYTGSGRYALVAFSIGNYGYVGTGWSGNGGPGFQYRDFWQYDPVGNSWISKANFGGSGRYGAVGFVISNKGYVGLGYTPYKSDFWEYDPIADTWSQKTDFPDTRVAAVGFGVGNKGYVGTGYKGSTSYNDFYEFDPVNNSWTAKSNVPGLKRRNAVAFNIGNYGYVGMGYNDTTYLTDFSKYDPLTDQWSVVASIGGVPRYGSYAFTVNDFGYVGGGSYGGIIATIPVPDFWRFGDCDGSPVGIRVIPASDNNNIYMSVSPDNRRGLILNYDLDGEKDAVFNFYNSLGQLILSVNLMPYSRSMNLAVLLNSEIYFYSITNNEKILKSGKVLIN